MATAPALLSWMGSLTDPTRLRLLRLLERHELGVQELVGVLQLPQSTVSRHLKVLSEAGWLRSRAQGPTNLYAMAEGNGDAGARRLWLLAREQTERWPVAAQDRLRLERWLERRERGTRSYFAAAARDWDRRREEAYGRAFAGEALLSLLPRDWVVADLGCGTGSVLAALAPYVRRVVGVDRSAAMLRAARRRTVGLPGVELRSGDLQALPLPAGSCDAALMVLVLSYLVEPGPALQEMARVLRPGGRAVVLDVLRHDREDFRLAMGQQHPGFAAEDLEARLRAAGLDDLRARSLAPEPEARGPALLLVSGTAPAGRTSPQAKGDTR
jgi:ArsR family transcriptional regulator